MISEDLVDRPYTLPAFTKKEIEAIEAALPAWVAANVFINRDKRKDTKLKNEFPQHESATAILASYGIKWGYQRGDCSLGDIETELRVRGARVLYGIDKRVTVRAKIHRILEELEVVWEEGIVRG